MIRAIVFSRDRPAQLDLLLDSIQLNAPFLFRSIVVLYKATSDEYARGYDMVKDSHTEALLLPEHNFHREVRVTLDSMYKHVCFLTDDDVFYRKFPYQPWPWVALDDDPDLLTVSLRLGLNTTYCYPMRQEQFFPGASEKKADLLSYIWKMGQWDFAYPASLDGNVWRRGDMLDFTAGEQFNNPNTLEDVLVKKVRRSPRRMMGCYRLSTLVNIPANRVNVTHRGNRHAEQFPHDTADLNARFLNGDKLALGQIDFSRIDAAHCERELVFQGGLPALP